MTTPVPRTGFSTEGLSGNEGWAAWRSVFAPLFDIRSEDEPADFHAEVDAFDLQQMVLTRMTFGGVTQQGVRTKELIRDSGLDHYGIEFCLHADHYSCEGRHGRVDIHAGSIVVLDLAQANTLVSSNSESISLTIPRRLLEAHCPDIERLHGSCIDAPGRARLLGEHMLALHRNLPHMTANEADAIAETTAALTGACLAPSADRFDRVRGTINHNLLDRARRYIANRLHDPHLSVSDICAAIGTSRSNLYRLFQPLGGVANCIRETRLRRAYAALRDPSEWRSISALAYRYGFVSAAHFSRAFRELFGFTPGDIRNLARTRTDPVSIREPDGKDDVATWLKNLRLD